MLILYLYIPYGRRYFCGACLQKITILTAAPVVELFLLQDKSVTFLERLGFFRRLSEKAKEVFSWEAVRSFNGRDIYSPLRNLLLFIGGNFPLAIFSLLFLSLAFVFLFQRRSLANFYKSAYFYIVLVSIVLEIIATSLSFLRVNFGLLSGTSEAVSLSKIRGALSRTKPLVHHIAGGFGFVFDADALSLYFTLLVLLIFWLVVLFFSDVFTSPASTVCFLVLKTSAIFVFLSQDVLGFVIGSEISLWALWLFLAGSSSRSNQFAGAYYVLYSSLGGILSLIGGLLIKASGASVLFADWLSNTLIEKYIGDFRFVFGMLFLMIGILVKIPVAPFHHWLLVAHVEASTAGSVILAAVLLKLPAYALIRILFSTSYSSLPYLRVIIIFFCGLSVFVCSVRLLLETDMKRFVALCSIIHMSTCISLLSLVNSKNMSELLSVVIILLYAHSLSSAAMFSFVGMLSSRLHTRNIREIHGLFKAVPQFSIHFFIISLLSSALPIGLTFSAEQALFLQLNNGPYTFIIVFYLVALFLVFLKTCAIFLQMAAGEKSSSQVTSDFTRSEFLLSLFFIFSLLITFVFGLYLVLLLGFSLHGAAALSFLPKLARKLINKGGAKSLKSVKLKRGNRLSRKPLPKNGSALQTYSADNVAQQHLDLNLRLRLAIKLASLGGLPGFGPSSVIDFKNSSDFKSTYAFPPTLQPSDVEIPAHLVPSRGRDSFFVASADNDASLKAEKEFCRRVNQQFLNLSRPSKDCDGIYFEIRSEAHACLEKCIKDYYSNPESTEAELRSCLYGCEFRAAEKEKAECRAFCKPVDEMFLKLRRQGVEQRISDKYYLANKNEISCLEKCIKNYYSNPESTEAELRSCLYGCEFRATEERKDRDWTCDQYRKYFNEMLHRPRKWEETTLNKEEKDKKSG